MNIINKMRMILIFITVVLLQAMLASAALANITPVISYLLSDSTTETNTSILLSFCSSDHGEELWKSDGTAGGTIEVKDIYPGETMFPPIEPYSSNPLELTDVNGTIFFQADTGLQNGYGKELWKSDGTEAGTKIVKDINVGGNAVPKNLTNVNGTLFFVAEDGVGGYGAEVWKSNGTEATTVLVQDLKPGTPGSNPSWLTSSGGKLYFQANAAGANQLWMSDGTIDGIVQLGVDINSPINLTDVNGILFFQANQGTVSNELFKSDGTEAGTELVKDIDPVSPSVPNGLTNVNGTLFFAADSEVYGMELWKSEAPYDDTSTNMVKDINDNGEGGSAPTELININSTLFFSATDGINGKELWISEEPYDNTSTYMIADINGTGDSNIEDMTNVDGVLFFTADNGVHGRELWKHVVTTGTTTMLQDITLGSTNFAELQSHNGLLFFKILTISGEELWISDGTESGTKSIKACAIVP